MAFGNIGNRLRMLNCSSLDPHYRISFSWLVSMFDARVVAFGNERGQADISRTQFPGHCTADPAAPLSLYVRAVNPVGGR